MGGKSVTRKRRTPTRRQILVGLGGIGGVGVVAYLADAKVFGAEQEDGREETSRTERTPDAATGAATGSGVSGEASREGTSTDGKARSGGASTSEKAGNTESQERGTGDRTPTTDEGSADTNTEKSAKKEGGSSTEKRDGLTVRFEPRTQTIKEGEEATYEIVVAGAVDDIAGYFLKVRLSDSSVATFESFEHAFDPEAHDETITDDVIDVSAGFANAISVVGEIKLGTLTIVGDEAGRTELRTRNSAENLRIISAATDDIVYDINGAGDGELTVVTETGSPTSENDRYSVTENSTLLVSKPGVLANDTAGETDTDELEASIIDKPTNGELTLRADGSFEYTPESGFTGKDTFTYEAEDETGGTDTARVTILVTQ